MGFFIAILIMLLVAALAFVFVRQTLSKKLSAPFPLVFSIAVAAIIILAGFYFISLIV